MLVLVRGMKCIHAVRACVRALCRALHRYLYRQVRGSKQLQLAVAGTVVGYNTFMHECTVNACHNNQAAHDPYPTGIPTSFTFADPVFDLMS